MKNEDIEKEVMFAGQIVSVKHMTTIKNGNMATFILETRTGEITVVAFPKVFSEYEQLIREKSFIIVRGTKDSGYNEEYNRLIHARRIRPTTSAALEVEEEKDV